MASGRIAAHAAQGRRSRLASQIGFVLVLWLAGCGGETEPEVAARRVGELHLDMAQGNVSAWLGENSFNYFFDAERAKEITGLLARGEATNLLREELADLWLAHADSLANAPTWQIRVSPWPEGVEAAAWLGHLAAPWSESGETIGQQHGLRFAPDTRSDQTMSSSGRRMLLVAPFHPGFAPIDDDPDTLRWALRETKAALDLVPRNDTTVSTVSAVLGEQRHGLLWLRAAPTTLHPLLGALETAPPICVWSQPGPDVAEAQGAEVQVGCLGSLRFHRAWFVQLRAQPDPETAEFGRRLTQALFDGAEASEALRRVWGPDSPPWILLAQADFRLSR